MTRTSISDLPFYLDCVNVALEDSVAFKTFKRLPGMETIESVKPGEGVEYRAIVLDQTPSLLDNLDKFKENDAYGNPITSPYPEGAMSATTWRYIKVLSDLQLLFGDIDGWDIVEIGAGYGGQCKIINDVYDFSSYTIFDLDPVIKLVKMYLKQIAPIALSKVNIENFRQLGQGAEKAYDLVISNWAFSECTREVQDLYIKHVLRHSRRGYITYNQFSHLCGIDSYRKDELFDALGFPVETMDEGLDIELPKDLEQFVLYWNTQPNLD